MQHASRSRRFRLGTMCEHSSACVSNPYDEGSYYCDCANAPFKSAVAGLYCEFIATTYCNTQQTVSRSAFCVNGGTCKAIVSGSQAFPGCQCPKGYIGTVRNDIVTLHAIFTVTCCGS